MSPELSPLGLEFDSESTSRSQDWRLLSWLARLAILAHLKMPSINPSPQHCVPTCAPNTCKHGHTHGGNEAEKRFQVFLFPSGRLCGINRFSMVMV